MSQPSLKQRLESGETAVGTFVNLDSPAVAEAASLAGLDFSILDQEHGPLTAETSLHVRRRRKRRWRRHRPRQGNSAPEIQRALDIGAAGVQIPQIESGEDARAAVDAARFEPEGQRGLSPYVRARGRLRRRRELHGRPERGDAGHRPRGGSGGSGQPRRHPGSRGGIDVIFLGPYDLSQALGVTGEVTGDLVVETMEDVCERAREAGKIVGAYADTPEIANEWIDVGVQYVAPLGRLCDPEGSVRGRRRRGRHGRIVAPASHSGTSAARVTSRFAESRSASWTSASGYSGVDQPPEGVVDPVFREELQGRLQVPGSVAHQGLHRDGLPDGLPRVDSRPLPGMMLPMTR